MVQRDITGIDLESRLADYVATIDRYDLLLGLILAGFAMAVLAGHLLETRKSPLSAPLSSRFGDERRFD